MAVTMNSVLLGDHAVRGAMAGTAFGDYPELFSAFYRSQYRYVLRICQRYLWRHEDAEDAAAEVFLKLHKLETDDNPIQSRSWLSKVTGRHCIDKLRRRKLEKGSGTDRAYLSDVPDYSTPSPLSQVLRNEEQLEVREQLIRLPKKFKVPLVLRYYRQMSYSEIACALKTRIPAVRMLIFRAKDQLRRNLRRDQCAKN